MAHASRIKGRRGKMSLLPTVMRTDGKPGITNSQGPPPRSVRPFGSISARWDPRCGGSALPSSPTRHAKKEAPPGTSTDTEKPRPHWESPHSQSPKLLLSITPAGPGLTAGVRRLSWGCPSSESACSRKHTLSTQARITNPARQSLSPQLPVDTKPHCKAFC